MLSDEARRRLGIPRLPLEDVLDPIIREEAEPHVEAEPRWRRRYPEYEEVLADFFARWQTADFEAAVRTPHQLATVTIKKVLDGLRRDGIIPPEDQAEALEPFERRVLMIVDEMDGKAHRKQITQSLSEGTGVRVLPTSIAAALNSLENRGLLWSRIPPRRADPENKRRRYFTITLAGKRALRSAN
ncbi:MAG TPA: hypothetical protein VKY31_10275 [Terriglobia bacterium]|nr:hypothetical protein [Terriglobia bacterium]